MKKFCFAVLFTLQLFSDCVADLKWNDLRRKPKKCFQVTWGPSLNGYYNRVPRSTEDPQFFEQNWSITNVNCENNNTFRGFQAVIPGDIGIALLYDINGVIAGIQQLLDKSSIRVQENDVKYSKLPVYQSQALENHEYFLTTVYFVDPSIICTSGRNVSDLDTQGTGTVVLIQNGTNPDAGLVSIPRNRSFALQQGWTMNQCFRGMGHHNFFQIENYQDHNCTEVFPFFGLFTEKGELLGFGFSNPGTVKHHRFENPSAQAISQIIGPEITPKCVIHSQKQIGLTSSHVFLIDKPWLLAC